MRVEFAPSPQDPPYLRLLGYDVVDDPLWQQTTLRLYWQALAALPENTRVWPFFFDDAGFLIEDTSQRPMVAPIWYPPAHWQPGETVITETLPWQMGARFNIGVAILDGEASARRWAVITADAGARPHQGRSWIQLGTFSRVGRYLTPAPDAPALLRADVTFAEGIRLVGYRVEAAAGSLSVVLAWQTQAAVARDYTAFVHLIAPDGTMLAQSDAQPHWGAEWPTSRWAPGETALDGHRLVLPAGAPPGPYKVRVGLYDWQTLQRLPVLDAGGQPVADYAALETSPPTR